MREAPFSVPRVEGLRLVIVLRVPMIVRFGVSGLVTIAVVVSGGGYGVILNLAAGMIVRQAVKRQMQSRNRNRGADESNGGDDRRLASGDEIHWILYGNSVDADCRNDAGSHHRSVGNAR